MSNKFNGSVFFLILMVYFKTLRFYDRFSQFTRISNLRRIVNTSPTHLFGGIRRYGIKVARCTSITFGWRRQSGRLYWLDNVRTAAKRIVSSTTQMDIEIFVHYRANIFDDISFGWSGEMLPDGQVARGLHERCTRTAALSNKHARTGCSETVGPALSPRARDQGSEHGGHPVCTSNSNNVVLL